MKELTRPQLTNQCKFLNVPVGQTSSEKRASVLTPARTSRRALHASHPSVQGSWRANVDPVHPAFEHRNTSAPTTVSLESKRTYSRGRELRVTLLMRWRVATLVLGSTESRSRLWQVSNAPAWGCMCSHDNVVLSASAEVECEFLLRYAICARTSGCRGDEIG